MVGLDYVINLIDKSFGSGIKKAKENTKELDNAVTKVNKNVGNLNKSSKKGFGGMIGMAKKAIPAMAAVFALNSIVAFGNELTNVTAKFEGYNNAITFASGNEANKNFTFLDKTIKDMSLDMDAAYSGFQSLSGALKGTSLEGQGLRDVFEGVSMAGSVMNLTSEQMKGAFLALGQIASKGKVQAEEIRGQLGERIPGALAIASKAMGVSQQSFNKMLDDGKIYAEDFLPKFAKELKNTFVDGMPAAANSMQAAINKKNNALLTFKRTFGNALRPVMTGVLEIGTKIFEFLGNLIEPIKAVYNETAQIFRPVTEAFKEGFSVLQNNADVGIVLTGVMDGLKYIFEILKPVLSFIYSIVGEVVKVFFKLVKITFRVVAEIIKFFKASEKVQRSLNALKAVVVTTFTGIRDAAKNILGGIGDVLEGVFTLDYQKIKDGFKKAFNGVKESAGASVKGIAAGIKAYNTDPASITAEELLKKQKTATIPKSANNKFGSTGTYGAGGAGTKTSKVSGQVASGSSVRNVTFNINSLVKELTVQPQTLQQGAQEVERTVKDMFLRLIRDVELQTQ